MKFLLIFLLPCLASGEILRLSKVVEAAGDRVTKYGYESGDEKKVIFVEDKAIVTEADVKLAMESGTQEHSVDISLTDEGGGKMAAATGAMRPGIDRIAILIRGKVKSAPVVQSVPLGKNFIISGLDGEGEAAELAGLLSGKNKRQIHKEKAEEE